MGRKSGRIIRKLEKKVIKNLGQDVTLRRNQYSTDDTTGLDMYGEPIAGSGYTDFDERTVRIVVDELRLIEEESSIGGISNKKKELLSFYISQAEEIALGDIIYYPAESSKAYEIDQINPYVFQDETLIQEVKAYRDVTTK